MNLLVGRKPGGAAKQMKDRGALATPEPGSSEPKKNFNAKAMFKKVHGTTTPASIVQSILNAANSDGSSLLALDPFEQQDDYFPSHFYLIDAINRRRQDTSIPLPEIPEKPLSAEEEAANLLGGVDWVNELERTWLKDEFLKALPDHKKQRLQTLRVYRRQFYEDIFGVGLGNGWLYENENIRGRGLDDHIQKAGGHATKDSCMDIFLWATAMGEMSAVEQIIVQLANPMEASLLGAALCMSLINDDERDSAFELKLNAKGKLEDIVELLNENASMLLQFSIKRNDKLTLQMLRELKVGKKVVRLSFIVEYGSFFRHHDYLDLANLAGNDQFTAAVLQDADGTGERLQERWFGEDVRIRTSLLFLLLMPLLPVLPLWPLKALVYKESSSKSCTKSYQDRLLCFMHAPVFGFLFDCLCYVGLVVTQTYITVKPVDETPLGSSPMTILSHLSPVEFVFLAFGAVHVLNQCHEMGMPSNKLSVAGYVRQFRNWCQSLWNVLDIVLISMATAAYVFRFQNEEVWWRIFMSLGLWVSWLRLLEYVASVNPTLGSMVNGLFAMGRDVVNFTLVMLFVMFGFGFCTYALMHPYGVRPDEEDYNLVYAVLIRPSWQMLGELFPDDEYTEPYDVTCTHAYDLEFLSSEGFRLQPGLEKCLTKNIGLVVLIVYAMITSVVLVNLLIAMMMSRWDEDQSKQKQKFAHDFFEMIDRYETYAPPLIQLTMMPIQLVLKALGRGDDAAKMSKRMLILGGEEMGKRLSAVSIRKVGGEEMTETVDRPSLDDSLVQDDTTTLAEKKAKDSRDALVHFVQEVKELFIKHSNAAGSAAKQEEVVKRMEERMEELAKTTQAQVGSLEKHIMMLLARGDGNNGSTGGGEGWAAGGKGGTKQQQMEQRIVEALQGTVQKLAVEMAAGMLAGGAEAEQEGKGEEGADDETEAAAAALATLAVGKQAEKQAGTQAEDNAPEKQAEGASAGNFEPAALSFGPYAPSPIKTSGADFDDNGAALSARSNSSGSRKPKSPKAWQWPQGKQQQEPRQRISPAGTMPPVAAGSLMNSLATVVAPTTTTTPANGMKETMQQPPPPPTPAEQIETARARGHLRLLFASPEFKDMV
jgi:hypothetical protein